MRIILLSSASGRQCARALRRFILGLLFLLPFWGEQVEAQDTIYSWTDEKGVIHYSNSMAPPQHQKEAATVVPSTHAPIQRGGFHEAATIPLVLMNNDPSQKFVRTVLESEYASREALMLVDTGAQITVIDEETAQALDVEHVQDALLAGVTGTSRGWIGRLRTLRVGEDVVNDLHVMVGPMNGRLLLGMDVLERLGLSVGLRSLHRASR